MDEFYTLTAVEIRQAIQERHIGIEELVGLYLDRISRYDGINGLNTVVEINPSVLEQSKQMDSKTVDSKSPLFGLPILVKDNVDVAGLHTTAGSLALKDTIAIRDAPVIANLRRRGAIILGKTNMTEFANYTTQNMPNGYSSRGGQVKNAYDNTKDPGGSSSGSAVAMSAGFCAAAVGTDTSFSVVACATENGVVGLKPPHGALSTKGIIPISHTLDSAGALTGTFTDALLIYSGMRDTALKNIAPTLPCNLRIAVNTYNRDQVSEAQLSRYEALFNKLRNTGAMFTEIYQPGSPYMSDIMRCEFKRDLEEYLAQSTAKFRSLEDIVSFYKSDPEKMIKYGITYLSAALNEATEKPNDEAYLRAMSERERMRKQILRDLKNYDACIMTGPTNIMHFTGLPSLALKLCMGNDNTPRGIILYGADEIKLFKAAVTIEKYCPPVSPPKLSPKYNAYAAIQP